MRRSSMTNAWALPRYIDDFSSGNLNNWFYSYLDWTWLNSTQFTSSGETSGQMRLTQNPTYAGQVNTCWWNVQKNGWQGVRGEVYSMKGYTSSGDTHKTGIVLHGINDNPTNNYLLYGYYASYDGGTTIQLSSYNNGTATSIASNSSITSTTTWKLTAFVNPLNHPTNPGLATVSLYNEAGTTLLGSASGTVTGSNDYTYGNVGIGAMPYSKGTTVFNYIDAFKIERKN